jgi:hypothetical protein
MPAKKSKPFGLKKPFLFFLFLLFLTAGLVLLFYFKPFSFKQDKVLVKTSLDQQQVLDSFGYPDTFTLIMMDGVRHEVWNYYLLQKSFEFLNGEFLKDRELSFLEAEFQFPKFKPTQFKEGMSLAEAQFLGDPTAEGEVSSDLLDNAKVYNFWDQVKVGVKDGRILYVETLPVFIPEDYQVNKEKESQ